MHVNTTSQISRWGVDDLLRRYPGLRVRSFRGGLLRIAGLLEFQAIQGEHEVTDVFEIELLVPRNFPADPPEVREKGGRIPRDFHIYEGRCLCLGSPLRLKMEAAAHPTLGGFVDSVVVPYFFNFIVGRRTGHLPLGELAHGNAGVLTDYRRILGARSDQECRDMLYLLAVRKRIANKAPCPCGSGSRVGRCHHLKLNRLRNVASRAWFRVEWQQIRPH